MAQRAGRLQKWSAFLIDLAAGVSGRCATSTAMPRHDAPDSSSSPVARSLWGPPLLRRRRPGTERALRVAVGTVRPGQRALARELLRSLFPVDVARERRHECDEVVELAFLEPEWLDVLIESLSPARKRSNGESNDVKLRSY